MQNLPISVSYDPQSIMAASIVYLAVAPMLGIAAEPDLEFAGVMVTNGRTRVSVRDTTTGATVWVEARQRYKGFTIAGYDEKKATLVLTKDGTHTTLPLREGRVQSAPPTQPVSGDATSQLAELKATRERLSLRYRSQHPDMVTINAQIAKLEGRALAK